MNYLGLICLIGLLSCHAKDPQPQPTAEGPKGKLKSIVNKAAGTEQLFEYDTASGALAKITYQSTDSSATWVVKRESSGKILEVNAELLVRGKKYQQKYLYNQTDPRLIVVQESHSLKPQRYSYEYVLNGTGQLQQCTQYELSTGNIVYVASRSYEWKDGNVATIKFRAPNQYEEVDWLYETQENPLAKLYREEGLRSTEVLHLSSQMPRLSVWLVAGTKRKYEQVYNTEKKLIESKESLFANSQWEVKQTLTYSYY